MALKDYREESVVSAIGKALKTCGRFPAPSEIIDIINMMAKTRLAAGDIEEIPEMADHDRDEVSELLAEFRGKMKWD